MAVDSEKKPLLSTQSQSPSKFAQWKQKYLTRDVVMLMVYTLLYIVTGVINSLFLKKVMNSFQNYPFFLNQVTNYGYIPIFGAAVVYELMFTKLITKEMRVFPWWKFLIMGALDAVCGYFVVIGGIRTSGPMQQLMNQAIIPVTMVGSYFVLKERFAPLQLGGALIIVGGVIVALVPSLLNKGDDTGNVAFFNIFYLINIIPFAASNVYKDIAFKSVDMDVWYLQFWDVFWQSVIGTFLFPINTVLPPPGKVAWKDIPGNLRDGGLCMLGKNLITPENSECSATNPNLLCDDCHNAWLVLLIYMIINVAYNIFILLVIKYGSATVLSIAQTIRLPLTNICFSSSALAGSAAVPFSPYSAGGLAVILTGLVSYRYGGLRKQKQAEAESGVESKPQVRPHLGPAGVDFIYEAVVQKPLLLPKTSQHLRRQYFNKLGLSTPVNINSDE